MICPKCGNENVRRSRRRGWEVMLKPIFINAYRCRKCRHRFYRFRLRAGRRERDEVRRREDADEG